MANDGARVTRGYGDCAGCSHRGVRTLPSPTGKGTVDHDSCFYDDVCGADPRVTRWRKAYFDNGTGCPGRAPVIGVCGTCVHRVSRSNMRGEASVMVPACAVNDTNPPHATTVAVGQWRSTNFDSASPTTACPGWKQKGVTMLRCDVSTARLRAARGERWEVYVEFHGADSANVSGRSDKFYSATATGLGPVKLAWGKVGAEGQSSTATLEEALRKINEKLAKGYKYTSDDAATRRWAPGADTVGVTTPKPAAAQPTAPPLTLRDMLQATTFRPATREELIDVSARNGWRRVPNDEQEFVDVFKGAEGVVLFDDREGRRWAVVKYPAEQRVYGRLHG